MSEVCTRRHALNAGRFISKWKRSREDPKDKRTHSGFGYAQRRSVQLITSDDNTGKKRERSYISPYANNKHSGFDFPRTYGVQRVIPANNGSGKESLGEER